MHAREIRGIETMLASVIIAMVAITAAALVLYVVMPYIHKSTSTQINVPPPLITSSEIIYYKPADIYYLLLHISNPSPEYIRLESIVIENCNGTVIKFIPVPKRNSTIVPVGEHTFNSSQMWASTLQATINPSYLNYQTFNYLRNLPQPEGTFAPTVNVTIDITNIKLLYPILNISLTGTSTEYVYPILHILGIGVEYYILCPTYSYVLPVSILNFVIGELRKPGTAKMEGYIDINYYCSNSSVTFQNLLYGEQPLSGGSPPYTLYTDLSNIHSIAIRLVSHYPLISNGQENFVHGELYLYVNGKLEYEYKYNWTLTFIYLPDCIQYVNVSFYVLKLPRIMSFNNVNMNIGIALVNNTTSALISQENIKISAPSILALTENFTNYVENPITKPGSGTLQPSSIYIEYINSTLVHPEVYDPSTQQSYPITVTIRGTLFNYTDIIGPYEYRTIALEFKSNHPIPPDECYMVTIDTDKGPLIIRNNGFIIMS
ncbi:MAG: hypothetical protein GXO10_03425 [Crenarchaeota archaeon]|nr:hypothetical protein [Thermoproteota archaeon]